MDIKGLILFAVLAGMPGAVFAQEKPLEYATNIHEADGLAFDSKGNLLVAGETWLGVIYRIDPYGKVSVLARGIPSADGIAIGKNDAVYVSSETMNGRVAVVGPDGRIQTLANLRNPEGMAFDSKGDLYVAEDIPEGRIVRILGQQVETVAEGLDRPENIAFDSAGYLYVTETGSNRILRIDPSGRKSLFTGGIEKPDGIIFSERFSGFFVTQDKPEGAHVYYVAMDGGIIPVIQNLHEPQGIAFDHKGDLYVAEQGKHRVIRIPAERIQGIK